MDQKTVDATIQLLDAMVDQQAKKVLKIAKRYYPHLSADDILDPANYPLLTNDPIFNYEDGFRAGLYGARVAILAEHKQALRKDT